jgi:hypothetical protein
MAFSLFWQVRTVTAVKHRIKNKDFDVMSLVEMAEMGDGFIQLAF